MEINDLEWLGLIERICKFIYRKWDYRLPGGLELEDLTQIGYLVMRRCKKSWDQERGSFETYLGRSIKNELNLVISSHKTLIHFPDHVLKSGKWKSERRDLVDFGRESEEFVDVEEVMRDLSERQKELVKMKIWEERSLAEIGRSKRIWEREVSRELVRQAWEQALEVMRKSCSEEM